MIELYQSRESSHFIIHKCKYRRLRADTFHPDGKLRKRSEKSIDKRGRECLRRKGAKEQRRAVNKRGVKGGKAWCFCSL